MSNYFFFTCLFIDMFEQAKIANQHHGARGKTLDSQEKLHEKYRTHHGAAQNWLTQIHVNFGNQVLITFLNIFNLEMLINGMLGHN